MSLSNKQKPVADKQNHAPRPLAWLLRPLATVAFALLVLVGVPLSSASAAPVEAHVVTYDASQAAEFQDAVNQGAQVWNDNATNVRFEPANGGAADVVILADDGWPRAQPDGLGAGTVWMGREAVNEGHDVVRIAAHELGHILGLPDRRTGVCEDLMSGASAGTGCKNSTPNPAEIDEVNQNFAGGKEGLSGPKDSVPGPKDRVLVIG